MLIVEQVAAVEVSDGNLALVPHEVTTGDKYAMHNVLLPFIINFGTSVLCIKSRLLINIHELFVFLFSVQQDAAETW